MADQPLPGLSETVLEAGAAKLLEALADVLKTSTSPEARQAQALLLRRLVVEGSVVPSRVPAPRNITEVGGYINLLTELKLNATRERLLSSALGLPGPDFEPNDIPAPRDLVLYDVTRANDRPEGPAQPSIPLEVRVRNDFASGVDAAIASLHRAGCALPVLWRPIALPELGAPLPRGAALLPYLGRTLDLVPACALVDPGADPLALAKKDGGAAFEVAARQLDAAAPDAASVAEAKWSAYKCDATKCELVDGNRKYLPLAPVLARAGFYPLPFSAPKRLTEPGSWSRFTNVTGLVAGQTRFGDELSARYPAGQIVASALRDALGWVWTGTAFEPLTP
jgi:hypothetical protein